MSGLPDGVKVKALVWNEYETEGEIDRWDADTALGSFYEIIAKFDGYALSTDHKLWVIHFETPQDAQAAAQADYEAGILAALESVQRDEP